MTKDAKVITGQHESPIYYVRQMTSPFQAVIDIAHRISLFRDESEQKQKALEGFDAETERRLEELEYEIRGIQREGLRSFGPVYDLLDKEPSE